ncbi:MAG: hypothetical protein U9O83_02390 [Campylobacterota bacterium]|nr:hypothetical protein [Campylobacterota bacterium]
MFYKSLIIVMFSFLTLLQADYVVEYEMSGEVQKFLYSDASHSKMINRSNDNEKSEIYRIGKKVYIVTGRDGNKHIIDVDEMRAMSKAMGFDASQYAKEAQEDAKDYKLTSTGKKVKVGGVRGEVYIIKGTFDGKAYKQEIVLTKNKKVVKAVRAMFSLFGAMSGIENSEDFSEVKKGYVTIKSDDMQLKSFKSMKIAKSEYELPKDAKKEKMPTYKKPPKRETAPKAEEREADEDVKMDEAMDMLKSFF